MGIDPSLPLWMTPYGFPPHGYKSFAFASDDAYRLPSFRTVVRMLCRKDGKQQYDME